MKTERNEEWNSLKKRLVMTMNSKREEGRQAVPVCLNQKWFQ
jgi:hypothetical protein